MKIMNAFLQNPLSQKTKKTSSFRYVFEPESSGFWLKKSLDSSHRHAGMTKVSTMKNALVFISLLFSTSIQAHHTKEHMMLFEDSRQIVSATQQGAEGGVFWLLWVGALILLLLGFIRWWKGRL